MPTPTTSFSIDVIGLGIFLLSMIVLLYDRFQLVKRHDEVLKDLRVTLDALDKRVNELTLAITGLGAEFHTYRQMKGEHE